MCTGMVALQSEHVQAEEIKVEQKEEEKFCAEVDIDSDHSCENDHSHESKLFIHLLFVDMMMLCNSIQ